MRAFGPDVAPGALDVGSIGAKVPYKVTWARGLGFSVIEFCSVAD